MPSTRQRDVPTSEGTLHVLEDGPAGTHAAIVLIHGFGEAAAVWEPMLGSLAAAHRVLRLDLLGHGESSKPRMGYTVPQQARAALAALEHCGARDVHMVGHSAGGDVVVAMLEQAAFRARSATFLGTAPRLDFVRVRASARLMRLPLIGPALWRGATDAMFRDGLEKVFAPDFPRVPDIYVQSLRRLPHHAYAQGLAGLERYKVERDLCTRLMPIRVPKLVVFGEEDTWVDPRAAEFWSARTDARVERVAGIGHTHMAEAPDAVSALTLDFIGNVKA